MRHAERTQGGQKATFRGLGGELSLSFALWVHFARPDAPGLRHDLLASWRWQGQRQEVSSRERGMRPARESEFNQNVRQDL